MWIEATVRYAEKSEIACEVKYTDVCDANGYLSPGEPVVADSGLIRVRRAAPGWSNRYFYSFIPLLEVQEITEKEYRR